MDIQKTTDTSFSFLVNRFNDSYIYGVNRNTFNQLGAQALLRKHFGDRPRAENSLFIVVGTDSGLFIRYVHEIGIADGSRFIFVEPDNLLPVIREQLADLQWHDRVRLLGPDEWIELREDFAFQDYAVLGRLNVLQSFAAMDAYLPDYRALHQVINSEIDKFKWQVRFQLGGQAFTEKQIQNSADNRIPALCLKNSFPGHTAVLLAGGPSLDDMIPWLKKHRDKLTLFAVSRVARRLLMADLQPDIVVSIDPHAVSFDVSKEMLRFDPQVLLVHSFHVTPLLLHQWRGPSAYLGARFPWDTPANAENLSGVGPTVTNTALRLAVDMGFERIIFGGVDLCFTRTGVTYATGSNENDIGPYLGSVGVQVQTNGGWMADTVHTFATAVQLMGNQAEGALKHGCQIVNPAPGAAKIENVDFVPLDEIELATPEHSTREILRQCLPTEDRDSRKASYEGLTKELARANGRLRKIKKIAEQALYCNDGLWGRKGIKADFKYKKRMDKIERRLDREFKDISPLIRQFGARSFARLLRPDRDREWTDQEIEDWGKGYYQSYLDSSDLILALVEDQQKRLKKRIAEEDERPDLPALLEYWPNDELPGRAAKWLWQHQRSLDSLSQAEAAGFARLDDELQAILDDRATAHLKRTKEEFSLSNVRSKAQILLLNNEQEELANLIEGLDAINEPEAAELYHLSSGYLYELRSDLDTALAHYRTVTDLALDSIEQAGDTQSLANPRLEDALKRMSGIALRNNDTDSALLLLNSLAALSPVYEPQYAEMLRLSGDIEGAINTYTEYLTKVPMDFDVMLKLGRIYQDLGIAESARWAYDYVAAKDPDNKAAFALLNSLPAAHSSDAG